MSVICNAIENLELLEIDYNGGSRIVEPHRLGESSNGNELLSCYQISGHSNSGRSEGWKRMKVENIDSVRPAGKNFYGPREGYNPDGERGMVDIYCDI